MCTLLYLKPKDLRVLVAVSKTGSASLDEIEDRTGLFDDTKEIVDGLVRRELLQTNGDLDIFRMTMNGRDVLRMEDLSILESA